MSTPERGISPAAREAAARALSGAPGSRGYAVLRGVLGRDALSAARGWIDAATADPAAIDPALQPALEAQAEGRPPAVRKIRRLTFHDPGFWRPWAERAGIHDLARAALPGAPAIILHAAFTKPARVGSPVVPHQDQALWDRPYPGAVTAWFALQDATPENGCLSMYPGSHLRGTLRHDARHGDGWHAAFDPEAEGLSPEPVPMAAGDVVVWHRHMGHSSGPNRSAHGRAAMVMVFADASAPGFEAADALSIESEDMTR